ncbi:hypothetical protein quinque_009881 [Culex quinquefasciatus]
MSRVFLLAVVAIGGSLTLVGALPVLSYDDDYDSVEDDYDVVFDQRQNGTENVRLNLDGLMIALPGPLQQSDLSSMAGAALMDVLAAHAGSFEGDSSEEDSNSKAKYHDFNDNVDYGANAHVPRGTFKQKKVSKHKRRYKLKVAHLLKPLLQRTYVV